MGCKKPNLSLHLLSKSNLISFLTISKGQTRPIVYTRPRAGAGVREKPRNSRFRNAPVVSKHHHLGQQTPTISKNSSIEERRSQWPRPSQSSKVDHIGIRVRNLDRALALYRGLGFDLVRRAEGDDVAIIRNEHGVELNLIFNANAGDPATDILMDVPDKFSRLHSHRAAVASIPATIAALKANDIAITQGPVSFGESRQVSVFVRDPRSQRHRAARPRTGHSRGRQYVP
jgi:lactoylglutathione lyase